MASSSCLRTNFRDEVTTKEAGGAEYSRYMPCDCAATWSTKGNDSLSRGKDCYIVQTALFVVSVDVI